MNLTLYRHTYSSVSTIGDLFIDGQYFCKTLEDTDRKLECDGEKVYGKTAIPRGAYNVIIDWSPRFKRELPHVLDVPGFEGIRIHSGNFVGKETYYKTVAVRADKEVLRTKEYVEVFDDG